MATLSSILAWKIPWMEKPVGYSTWGHKELDMTERLLLTFQYDKLLSQLIGKGSLNKKDHPTCQHWGVIPTC